MLRNRVGCSPDVVECGDSSPLDTKGGDGKVGIRSCSDRFRHFAVPLPETPAKAGLFRPTFYPPVLLSAKDCRLTAIRFGVSRLALTGKASFATPCVTSVNKEK